jgi:MFS family permease
MSMSMFIFTPVCWPLGVVSGTSLPPVGTTELASGVALSLPPQHESHLRVLAGWQWRLAEIGQHAVGQFEVPSNLLLEKIGARLTFLRIMVLWGLTSAATAIVTEAWQFYGIRLLLGMFEAGFFPGIILFLTYWCPSHRRGRVTGLFLFGMPITGVLGGPLSGMIMGGMEGLDGMHGWQWLFIVEGLPTVLLGFLLYRLLPNKPREARWLNDGEKALVQSVLDTDHKVDVKPGHHGKLAAALADPKTYVLAFVYFCCACAVYTVTFWLPTMIKGLGIASIASIGWIVLGGHVRVGLEDNLYYEHGVLATNVQLVERLVRLVREMGYEPATPSEARQIIGLRPLR